SAGVSGGVAAAGSTGSGLADGAGATWMPRACGPGGDAAALAAAGAVVPGAGWASGAGRGGGGGRCRRGRGPGGRAGGRWGGGAGRIVGGRGRFWLGKEAGGHRRVPRQENWSEHPGGDQPDAERRSNHQDARQARGPVLREIDLVVVVVTHQPPRSPARRE